MVALPTALLLHTCPSGTHHDWLIADPTAAGADPGPLWTARLRPHSRFWADLRAFDLTILPRHRPLYLTYEGPVGAGRGKVRRVDQGRAVPLLWSETRIIVDTRFRYFQGLVELCRSGGSLWRARCWR